jgi:hypothetical protein
MTAPGKATIDRRWEGWHGHSDEVEVIYAVATNLACNANDECANISDGNSLAHRQPKPNLDIFKVKEIQGESL